MNEVARLIGVYDADGTIFGELSYFAGKRLGRSHCALCDITHGLVRERDEWRRQRDRLPAPFDTFHRNDQPDTVRASSGGVVPVVVAETGDGRIVVLASPEAIARCAGAPAQLVEAIHGAVADHGLTWPRSDD